eukprot:gene7602-8208_t
MKWSFFVLLLISIFRRSNGSYGDYESTYQRCFQVCLYECDVDPRHLEDTRYPPLNTTSIISWLCDDRCHYNCMDMVTSQRLLEKGAIFKYYGHWPFIRWFGFEEPASALFSALNSLSHLNWLYRVIFKSNNNKSSSNMYMRPWLVLYASISVNAWIASTYFHTKKHDFSIFYDYSSALLVLVSGLLLIIRRIGGKTMPYWSQALIAGGLFTYTFYRIGVMFYKPQRISFQQHLHFCIGIAVITTILWIIWILYQYIAVTGYSFVTSLKYAIIVQIWFVIASMFEIFDFPPIYRTIDAHACWHALTIPLGFVFYRFWLLDFEYEENKKNRTEKSK